MSDGKGRGWYGDPDGHREAAKQAQEGSQSALGRGLSYASLPFVLVGRGASFLLSQARGTWRNLGRGWDYLTFDNILPPSLVGLGQWLIETMPKLAGIRSTTPWQQVGAAFSVIGFALLASFLTGGFLIGTVVIVAGLGSIGIIRFVPAVNDKWEAWTAALPIKRDYDVPRWERD